MAEDVVLLVLLEVDGPLVVTAVALSLVRHLWSLGCCCAVCWIEELSTDRCYETTTDEGLSNRLYLSIERTQAPWTGGGILSLNPCRLQCPAYVVKRGRHKQSSAQEFDIKCSGSGSLRQCNNQ